MDNSLNNRVSIRRKFLFTQVSDDVLNDSDISLKAKGLYSLIQSYLIGRNNTVYKDELRKVCKEGERAFDSAWKELKNKGYLIQYKLKDEKGIFYYEYELLISKFL